MVRIWCVPFNILDMAHRSGVHREVESLRTAYTKHVLGIKGGFQRHPEFLRFKNKPGMLIDIHETIVPLLKHHNTPFRWGYTIDYGLPSQHFVTVDLDVQREHYTYSFDEFHRDLCDLSERNGVNW